MTGAYLLTLLVKSYFIQVYQADCQERCIATGLLQDATGILTTLSTNGEFWEWSKALCSSRIRRTSIHTVLFILRVYVMYNHSLLVLAPGGSLIITRAVFDILVRFGSSYSAYSGKSWKPSQEEFSVHWATSAGQVFVSFSRCGVDESNTSLYEE